MILPERGVCVHERHLAHLSLQGLSGQQGKRVGPLVGEADLAVAVPGELFRVVGLAGEAGLVGRGQSTGHSGEQQPALEPVSPEFDLAELILLCLSIGVAHGRVFDHGIVARGHHNHLRWAIADALVVLESKWVVSTKQKNTSTQIKLHLHIE